MKQIFDSLLAFIRGNYKRFIWELVAVALGILATWLIGHFTENRALTACQDERTELLRQSNASQAFKDSVRWQAKLDALALEKDKTIKRQKLELDYLHEKNALDSAAMLTEYEAMRAINERYKKARR
jgi:hypothetical protein